MKLSTIVETMRSLDYLEMLSLDSICLSDINAGNNILSNKFSNLGLNPMILNKKKHCLYKGVADLLHDCERY